MAIKKINTDLQIEAGLLDGDGNSGTNNQVLISTGTGVDWVNASASGIIGGPYLPLAGGTLTGNLTITGGSDIFLADNGKTHYGASNDLEIYHNGTHSYIDEKGTGDLIIRSTLLRLQSNGGESMINASSNGTVQLYYDNSEKLKTATTGINVTGTAQMDTGITEGIHYVGTAVEHWGDGGTGMTFPANDTISLRTASSDRLYINSSGNVGVGTTSPLSRLHVVSREINNGANKGIRIENYNGTKDYSIRTGVSGLENTSLAFYDETAGANRIVITSAGNVGIGTTSPTTKLSVVGTSSITDTLTLGTTAGSNLSMLRTSANYINATNATGYLVFRTGGYNIALTLDASQNATFAGDVTVAGKVTAQEFHTEFVSASIMYDSGSTKFGDTSDDIHSFTGSLNVEGNMELSTGGYLYGDTTTTYLRLNTAVGSLLGYSNAYIGLGPSFIYNVGGSEKFRIQSSTGNVGIGTSSPAVKLDVRGQMLVAGDTPVARIGSTLEVYRNGTTAELSIHQDDSTVSSSLFSQLRFRNGGNDTYFKVPQNGNGLIIDVEGKTNAFVISTAGNVGIGTTAPDARLHVDSATAFSLTDGSADTLLLTNDSTTSTIGAIGPSIGFGNMNSNRRTSAIAAVRTGGDHDNMGLAFFTHPSDSNDETVVQKMTIKHDGNVGIGTTSPVSPLTVKSNSVSSGESGLTIQANANTNTIIKLGERANDGGRFEMLDAGVTKIALFTDGTDNYINAGKVGIGTTSPGYKLTVAGDAGFSDWIYASKFYPTSSTTDILMQTGAGRTITLDPTSTGKVLIPNGNVGIGTTSPQASFHHKPSSSGLTFTNIEGTLIETGGSSNQYFALQVASAGGGKSFNVTNAGNVGIGTASPATPLHVDLGTVDVKAQLNAIGGFDGMLVDGTNASYNLIGGNGDKYALGALNDGSFRIYNEGGAGYALTLNNSGKLGIGTTAPQEKLDISAGSIRLDDLTSIKWATDDTKIGRVRITGNEANDYLQFVTDNSEKMRLTNTGLGIGTTSPTHKLEVIGGSNDTMRVYRPGNRTLLNIDADAGRTSALSIDIAGTTQYYVGMPTQAVSGLGARFAISYQGDPSLVLEGSTGKIGIGTTSPTAKLDIEGDLQVKGVNISNQENLDVDTGTETIATVVKANYDAAFFDFVIKNGTNLRAGTVFAIHDGTNVEFTETSTNDLGDTSDVTLSVDISGTDMRLRATTTSDNWIIKSLVRTI